MNTANTTGKAVWINTDMHRATAMEEDIEYPIPDYRQGRDCKNPVPPFSMYSGQPDEDLAEVDGDLKHWTCMAVGALLTVGWALGLVALIEKLVSLLPEAQ